MQPSYKITCQDGTVYEPLEFRCVGSVEEARSRDISEPPVVGQFPVLVERSGDYRMFTYNRKIKSIEAVPQTAGTHRRPEIV